MENIFAYGTLKDPKVQKYIFGKIAKSSPAVLLDDARSKTKIDKIYPIIIKKKGNFVRGMVFSVTQKELKLIDEYEGKPYKRQKVILKSGVSAWVYAK